MKRRSFIAHAAAVGSSVGAPVLTGHLRASEPAEAGTPTTSPARIIDTNVYLGAHPFRESITAKPQAFALKLADRKVSEAWAGSFEALLQRDITGVNERLTRDCRAAGGILKPVGSIHPKLPDWRGDLARCAEQHGMKAIRLHPNYHGYALDDPAFVELLEAAAAKKLLVQIAAQMEDERTQHPLVQVKPVDLKPLAAVLKKLPEARVMVLNANRVMSMTALAGTKVWLDIAMLEGVGGVENLLKDWPQNRVVFGSFAPFFYFESARLKLQESELTAAQLAAITAGNASSLAG
ncbi:MAG: amidohydrolase [Verrucomicrobiaceae bacterium]|nr:amidohydrolase [Verrucomicrobiaceae bacterium]